MNYTCSGVNKVKTHSKKQICLRQTFQMAFPSCDALKRGLKPVDFRYFRTGSNTEFPLHQKLHMHTLKVGERKGEASGSDALWRTIPYFESFK